jgi:hypothetical protein
MRVSSLRVTIFDKTTPLLQEIAKVSYGMALESLSVAGSHVRDASRKALIRHKHNWQQEVNLSGNRRIYYDTTPRELGLRMSHKTGLLDKPDSMANFITSYLMEKSMTVVIGAKHPSFVPNKREDGKVTGKLGRVNAVSKHTHSILHKLNFGERNDEHNWGGKDSMKNFEGANYVARNFMDDGYTMSKGAVIKSMTTRYEKMLHRAISKVNVVAERKVV